MSSVPNCTSLWQTFSSHQSVLYKKNCFLNKAKLFFAKIEFYRNIRLQLQTLRRLKHEKRIKPTSSWNLVCVLMSNFDKYGTTNNYLINWLEIINSVKISFLSVGTHSLSQLLHSKTKIILFPFTPNGGHKCTKQNSKSQLQCWIHYTFRIVWEQRTFYC